MSKGHWELEFRAHKDGFYANHRHNIGIIIRHPNRYNEWYCNKLKRWGSLEDFKGYSCSTHCNVKSLRGFLRHLRNHSELKEAESVFLVSRMNNQGVIARWVNQ